MQVAASLRTGREAVEQIEQCNPDVVVLDVDMPELDGISALPLLLQKKRDLVVIMVSTLTRRSAEISLRALALGAADYIPKPETAREATTSAAFRRELIEKIRTSAVSRRRRAALCAVTAPETSVGAKPAIAALRHRKSPRRSRDPAVALRPFASSIAAGTC